MSANLVEGPPTVGKESRQSSLSSAMTSVVLAVDRLEDLYCEITGAGGALPKEGGALSTMPPMPPLIPFLNQYQDSLNEIAGRINVLVDKIKEELVWSHGSR